MTKCRIRNCGAECPDHHLMCSKHWAMVPVSLQKAIVEEYQADKARPKGPSVEYVQLAITARKGVEALLKLSPQAEGIPQGDAQVDEQAEAPAAAAPKVKRGSKKQKH